MSATSMPSKPIIPQDSALRVVKGSIAASVAATAGGSIYGLMKAQPATIYGFQTGANTFVFAFPFFALREYAISPLLKEKDNTQTPSLHTNNVLASAISGTIVGGAMSAYFRGPQKFVSGSTTFGIMCTCLQFLGNELRLLRVHYLAPLSDPEVSIDSQAAPSLRKPVTPQVDSPSQAQLQPSPSQTQKQQTTTSWLQKAGSYLSSFSPVKKISDEDYYEQLKARRRQIIERLQEVDGSIGDDGSQHKV